MMKRRGAGLLSVLALAVLWGTLLGFQAVSAKPTSAPVDRATGFTDERAREGEAVAGIRVIRSDASGIVFELDTPDYALELDADADCEALSVEGYGLTDRGGWPQMPVRGALIGVPPGADVSLTVVEVDEVVAPGAHRLCPVPTLQAESSLDDSVPQYGGESLVFDPRAYDDPGLQPEAVAHITEIGWLRDRRVAQLELIPFRYDAANGELHHIQRMRVHLRFEGSSTVDLDADEAGTTETHPDPFGDPGAVLLLNADAAQEWRVRRPVAPIQPGLQATQAISPSYKILVDRDGLYEVTYAELAAVGVPVDQVDPRTFRVTNHGVEAAIEVMGEDDGSFDAGDALRFYGEGIETQYSDTNVYWLSWRHSPGRRMPQRTVTPHSAISPLLSYNANYHWGEDNFYQSLIPSGDDHWFADYINTSAPASKTFTFTLENVVTLPYSATMRGELFGYSHFGPSPDHHTRVYLNGHLVDDATWDGFRIYRFEHDIPASYLVEGVNEITVELPFDFTGDVISDIVIFNWFDLDYRDQFVAEDDGLRFSKTLSATNAFEVTGFTTETLEAYDVTSSTHPVRLANPSVIGEAGDFSVTFEETVTGTHRYLVQATDRRLSPPAIEADVPSSWRDSSNRADYVIITHGDFYTEVLSLAAHREAQGLRVAVVDVQDVYDEFNGGVFHPEAIRDFLTYTYEKWTAPSPSYVLLVGDGTFDFKDIYGRGERTYIPPYLASVDPWMGETAADNRYVAVHGEDIFPDMHLGRMPVSTPDEAAAMVDKVIAYETGLPSGDWIKQVLFIADNPDDAGDFYALSDSVIDDHLPAPYIPGKIYYKQTHSTGSAVKSAIFSGFDEGRLMVNYIGHATIDFWGFEHFFDRDDIPTLNNGGRQPFVVPMTCLEGYYIQPNSPSLNLSSFAETLVRASGKGAIASWSPTGFGVAEGHDFLNRSLYDAIFRNGVTQVGPATTQAKLYLMASTGGYRDLIDTYLLFGDPALQLPILGADVGITKDSGPPGPLWPGDAVTYTLAYTNAGPGTAANVVITDMLPSGLLNPVVVSSGATITPRAGSRFVWDVADLGPGVGGAITLTAVVSPTFHGTLTNTAKIVTTGVETATANNAAGPVVIQVDAPDLGIEKAGPDDAGAGDWVTYTLTYANTGSRLAQGVAITDPLASALTDAGVVSSGAVITPRAGSRYVWDVADLAPGGEGTITVTARISPTFQGVISNTAVIATSDVDVNPGNNRSDPVRTGVDTPDLVIGKRGPTEAYGGATITYILTYTNAGPAAAANVVITDALPSQLLNPAVASGGAVITPRVGSRFVWDVAILAPGEGGVITLTAEVSPTYYGVISNTVRILSPAVEKETDNNVAGPVLTVVGTPDLVIEKEATPWDWAYIEPESVRGTTGSWTSRAWAGYAITYTLTYANVGTAPARQVTLSDALPTSLLDPAVVSSGAVITAQKGSRFTWDVADLAPGAGGTITVTGRIDPTYRGVLTNTAGITTTGVETRTTNNLAGPLFTRVDAIDLLIDKAGPPQARPGEFITYTLTYTHAGTVPSYQAVITESLPAVLTDVSVASDGPTLALRPGSRFVWDVATFSPGTGGTITITGRIPASHTDPLTNRASIAMPDGEAIPENNHTATITTEVLLPDLAIDKYGPSQVQVGDRITYTLTYTNAGPATAHHVVLTDTLHAALTDTAVFASGAAITPRTGSRYVWDVTDLGAGEGGVITVTAAISPTFRGVLTNTATLATTAVESSLDDNRAQVTTTVSPHTLYLPLVTRMGE